MLAAGGAQLVDFSFRRIQGIDAGLSVARASAIAGFAATSNAEAARRFGLAAAGMMAHSFIEAFADEDGRSPRSPRTSPVGRRSCSTLMTPTAGCAPPSRWHAGCS